MMILNIVIMLSIVMKLNGWLNSSSVVIMLISLSGVVSMIISMCEKFCSWIISSVNMVIVISGICVLIDFCVFVFFLIELLMLI